MYRKLLSQHRRIRALIEQFEAYLEPSSPPSDAEAMIRCRWQLASQIFEHLALEDQTIYLPLAQDSRDDVVRETRRNKLELERLFDRTQKHVETWPTAAALGSWPEYCRETRELLAAFRVRLSDEEEGPYLWARTNPDIQAGALMPHERNWVAPAWIVRDRIHTGL